MVKRVFYEISIIFVDVLMLPESDQVLYRRRTSHTFVRDEHVHFHRKASKECRLPYFSSLADKLGHSLYFFFDHFSHTGTFTSLRPLIYRQEQSSLLLESRVQIRKEILTVILSASLYCYTFLLLNLPDTCLQVEKFVTCS